MWNMYIDTDIHTLRNQLIAAIPEKENEIQNLNKIQLQDLKKSLERYYQQRLSEDLRAVFETHMSLWVA